MLEEHKMTVRIQLRRDTAAQWQSINPTLLSGEIGIETDTLKFKIGNGLRWNQITSYAFKPGEANGVATLNSSGKLVSSQLPDAVSITADINAAFAALSTTTLVEGSNLYFTDERAIEAVASEIASEVVEINAAIESAKSQAVVISTTDATNKAAAAQLNAINAAELKDVTAISTATAAANSYTDSAIDQESSNRSIAISDAINSEITNRNIAIAAVTTSDVAEGTNLYFTNARAVSAVQSQLNDISLATKTTDDLAEGSENLYFTNSRAVEALNTTITDTVISVNSNIDSLSTYLFNNYTNTSDADSKYVLQSGLQNSLDGYVDEGQRDAAFGFPGLDASSKINVDRIPSSIARASAVTTEISSAISTEVTNRNSAITAAIDTLVDSAPGTLNTLGEIASLLQSAESTAGLTEILTLKAPIESPSFTGTVSGITKSMVELANVDNTSDLDKPISTLTQTALDDKANSNNPVFTGSIDFTNVSLSGLPSTLPNQLGYAGKYLKTDGTNSSWEDVDFSLYLTSLLASTTYATIDNAKEYGYHNSSDGSIANKIAYGTSATGYTSIATPVAGDIYIQY
jgi:hypothetical protein